MLPDWQILSTDFPSALPVHVAERGRDRITVSLVHAEVQTEVLSGVDKAGRNEVCSLCQGQPCAGRDRSRRGLSVTSESL